VTATAVYYADLDVAGRIARLLGKSSDVDEFRTAAEKVRTAFRRMPLNSQTGYAMALALDLAPEGSRRELLDKLVADIRSRGNHTTAGDVGFHYVVQALSEGGRSDVVYDLVTADASSPSYAAQLAKGATTLTEAWDAGPRSSQNHFMLGHVEEWFYRYLAGIDLDLSRPREERITLRPTPVGDLASASASLDSPLGRIVSSWRKVNGKILVDVEVPQNAQAKVVLPARGGPVSKQVNGGRHHFEVDARTTP
jgi:hypothetical protein